MDIWYELSLRELYEPPSSGPAGLLQEALGPRPPADRIPADWIPVRDEPDVENGDLGPELPATS